MRVKRLVYVNVAETLTNNLIERQNFRGLHWGLSGDNQNLIRTVIMPNAETENRAELVGHHREGASEHAEGLVHQEDHAVRHDDAGCRDRVLRGRGVRSRS